MKISILVYIIIVLSFATNQFSIVNSYAAEDNINISNFSSIDILTDYIENYNKQINRLFIKYEISNSQIINGFNSSISRIYSQIISINIEDNNSNEQLSTAVDDLKNLNSKMKVYLDQEKIIYEQRIKKQQEKYITIGNSISKILDTLIADITNFLSKKQTLTQQEKNIIISLVELRKQNNKLKNFSSLQFGSEDQMKEYFKAIIISIRKEIVILKTGS